MYQRIFQDNVNEPLSRFALWVTHLALYNAQCQMQSDKALYNVYLIKFRAHQLIL